MTRNAPNDSLVVKHSDLVLSVSTDVDPKVLDLDAYDAFLDALCADREFQKHAIRTVVGFLGGGQYDSTANLATSNWASNTTLHQHYGTRDRFIEALPFPTKLACAVDHATGTGKSYVMYGIARILLAENIVDRVLVLCPSLTIEAGLRTKFLQLTSDPTLDALVPAGRLYRRPQITDASVTTLAGDVCIENIDATYAHVRSSVRDSFRGRGATTLVINDEAHHIYSRAEGDSRSLKRWKEFLDDQEFGFHRMVGLSGTCFVGNEYFPDVVARYGVREAMVNGYIKTIHYVAKDESDSAEELFQKILANHQLNQQKYPALKALSIIVTARIKGAHNLAREFTQFLARANGRTLAEAEQQVLVVTSKDPAAVAKLPMVDDPDDPTEWIISVSMLTEGWDVKNVMQIVPHEKRAFNSKLLIAQVLGRGLRVPPLVGHPVVRVFNHSSWSSEIQSLVDEVLEYERRLTSEPVLIPERAQHHFELDQLTYTTRTRVVELQSKNGNGQVSLFTRGYVQFEPQPADLQRRTTYVSVLDRTEYDVSTRVTRTGYTVAEAVHRILAKLRAFDADANTNYASQYPADRLAEVVRESLDRIGETRDLVWDANLQHLLRAIGNIERRNARTVRVDRDPDQLVKVSTSSMRSRSVTLPAFRKEATVFYDSLSKDCTESEEVASLEEVLTDDAYPRHASVEVPNRYFFKSPVNFVLTTHGPERAFVRRLVSAEASKRVDSWVKAPDVGFYEIFYSWRKADHTKTARFNPDFFIRLVDKKRTLVVELKDDDDTTDENRAKFKFASQHFSHVNTLQGEHHYAVHFVSPASYDNFFQALIQDTVDGFVSALQAALLNG